MGHRVLIVSAHAGLDEMLASFLLNASLGRSAGPKLVLSARGRAGLWT